MKNLSKKSVLFITGVIFFLIPLIFSHLPKALGFPIILGSSSYERIKIELFYILLAILTPFWITSPFFRKTQEIFQKKENLIWTGIFLGVMAISVLLAPDTETAIFGWLEKRQGILLFFALGIFGIILKTLPETYKNTLIKISFASMLCVLFYATMQWMGLDQLGSRYTLSFSGDRAFSTLGNPNYLAGFFILFLPLVREITRTRGMRNIWYAIILFGTAITGSLFGICIVGGYFAFQLLLSYKNRKYTLLIIPLCMLGIFTISPIVPVDKAGSMEHRLIIWSTTVRIMKENPERILFGYGPEVFRTIFPNYIKNEDAHYFEDNTPDRSHNIFLDIFFSFGAVWLGAFFWALIVFFLRNRITEVKNQSIILFLLFFSINIPVLVHFLLVGLAISTRER